MTSASLHNSQVFEELLDHTIDPETGKKRDAFADSAYRVHPEIPLNPNKHLTPNQF